MKECCKNCRHLGELIMWELNSEGRYLPNYDKPLECCMVFASEGTIYGHTMPTDESDMCEMFTPKKIPESCKECDKAYLICKPPLCQKYCDVVNDDVSHKTKTRHPRCPYNHIATEESKHEERL